MSEGLDPNKVASQVIIHASERAIAAASAPLRSNLRRTLHLLLDAYKPFLEKTYRRVSSIRTFLKPTESVDLLTHYVPVDLTDKEVDIAVDNVVSDLLLGKKVVVSGLAGRGKSVLMRYIALALFNSGGSRIPLFLELRSLNSLTSKNVLQLVHSQYQGSSSIGFNDFTRALKGGHFILVLDGFDEVAPTDRDNVEAQLIDFGDAYPDVGIIVSGRPYDRYASWEQYRTLHLKPMRLDQTRDLIEISSYDEDVKKVFLKRLTPQFFAKHESFLNTPLLAIMLMLTFEEYAEIPVSLHEFYRNAFDTLIRRHDAMKAQFLRETHSGCTAEEFKKIFSAFCLLTYSQSAFTFNKDEIKGFLDIALKQQKMTYSATKVLDDLIESICLLQEEGFEISFVHRSFQEYFCAVFVSTASAGILAKFLDSGRYRTNDDVLVMLYGMVPERVESEWANEKVAEITAMFPEKDEDSVLKYAIASYPEIELLAAGSELGPIIMRFESELHKQVMVIRRIYPAQFYTTRPQPIINEEGRIAWRGRVLAAIKALEESDDAQFRGYTNSAVSTKKGEAGRTFVIKLNSDHRDFVLSIFGEASAGDLKALRVIQKEQRSRVRGGDSFIKEVFAT